MGRHKGIAFPPLRSDFAAHFVLDSSIFEENYWDYMNALVVSISDELERKRNIQIRKGF